MVFISVVKQAHVRIHILYFSMYNLEELPAYITYTCCPVCCPLSFVKYMLLSDSKTNKISFIPYLSCVVC